MVKLADAPPCLGGGKVDYFPYRTGSIPVLAAMKEFIGKKVLVTTHDWFMGKDGRNYKAVYGTLVSVTELKDSIGFAPSRQHANWALQVGTMVIIGCQVQNVEQVEIKMDPLKPVSDFDFKDGIVTYYDRPTTIYHAL